ncbi:M23 family metallopeptidase, partial [bacterium]|nr:M23 family metallopeptidase [bacterium]
NREGTEVGAAASGTVSRVGYNWGYGRYIVITHAGGMETLYGHLSRQLVRVGQEVDKGQVIGREGDTGRSTGPHLHFEIHKNGQSVDPESYVRVHR